MVLDLKGDSSLEDGYPQYVSNVSLLYEHLLAVHNINALVSADCASSFYCAVEESAALNVSNLYVCGNCGVERDFAFASLRCERLNCSVVNACRVALEVRHEADIAVHAVSRDSVLAVNELRSLHGVLLPLRVLVLCACTLEVVAVANLNVVEQEALSRLRLNLECLTERSGLTSHRLAVSKKNLAVQAAAVLLCSAINVYVIVVDVHENVNDTATIVGDVVACCGAAARVNVVPVYLDRKSVV